MLTIKTEIWANNEKESKKTVSERKKISKRNEWQGDIDNDDNAAWMFQPYGIEKCGRYTHCAAAAARNKNKWWTKKRRRQKV